MYKSPLSHPKHPLCSRTNMRSNETRINTSVASIAGNLLAGENIQFDAECATIVYILWGISKFADLLKYIMYAGNDTVLLWSKTLLFRFYTFTVVRFCLYWQYLTSVLWYESVSLWRGEVLPPVHTELVAGNYKLQYQIAISKPWSPHSPVSWGQMREEFVQLVIIRASNKLHVFISRIQMKTHFVLQQQLKWLNESL